MLRGNIAATSLKIVLENLVSVKCYDLSNINVFTLSLWENMRWGLIYFDQFMSVIFDTLGIKSFLLILIWSSANLKKQTDQGLPYWLF